MPLFGRFSRGSPASPAPSFRRRSIFTSITLIGSQDLAVTSRPNLSLFILQKLIRLATAVVIILVRHVLNRWHTRFQLRHFLKAASSTSNQKKEQLESFRERDNIKSTESRTGPWTKDEVDRSRWLRTISMSQHSTAFLPIQLAKMAWIGFKLGRIGVDQYWVHAQKTNKQSTSSLVYALDHVLCAVRYILPSPHSTRQTYVGVAATVEQLCVQRVSIHQGLRKYGTFRSPHEGVRHFEEEVLDKVEVNPPSNTSVIAHDIDVSLTSLWRVLRQLRLHTFHVKKPARLLPRRTVFNPRPGHSRNFACGNRAGRCHWTAVFFPRICSFPRPFIPSAVTYSPQSHPTALETSLLRATQITYLIRMRFSQIFMQQCNAELEFASRVLFIDEAYFTRDGYFSTHNSHVWTEENPRQAVMAVRHQQLLDRLSSNTFRRPGVPQLSGQRFDMMVPCRVLSVLGEAAQCHGHHGHPTSHIPSISSCGATQRLVCTLRLWGTAKFSYNEYKGHATRFKPLLASSRGSARPYISFATSEIKRRAAILNT
ncbi:hypothetical protein PR048_001408 [Dryococelus australis]|uniref:Uncharacterized protein n=1 Tax=Dryococelus australis TaxID=614101 RepID=A0ABQ9IHD5_9NEOP|nr:hypothetical protein PR048_001408 [Dryococelus australis]